MTNWDNKFIGLAKHIAEWSKDTNRKVGSLIVDSDNRIISTGYNGFPIKCDDTIKSRYERPDKYLFTEHSERNAIYNAARYGTSLKDCYMYVTSFPCADCARGIIQSGIIKLITTPPDLESEIWGTQFKAALQMLEEANIEIQFV